MGKPGDDIWPDDRECPEFCVSVPVRGGFKYGHALKRSSNMIANWLQAANHSRTFLPPFSKFRIAGQISLVAASPVRNEPRVLMDLRITRFRLSMAFVVQMILRIAGSKAGNGITSCHARRQAGAMEACFPARFSSNASSSSAAKSAVESAVGECPIICVSLICSMLCERSNDDDDFQGTSEGCERPEDLLGDAGLMKELKIKLMERMLGAELTAHLGYEFHPGRSDRPSLFWPVHGKIGPA